MALSKDPITLNGQQKVIFENKKKQKDEISQALECQPENQSDHQPEHQPENLVGTVIVELKPIDAVGK